LWENYEKQGIKKRRVDGSDPFWWVTRGRYRKPDRMGGMEWIGYPVFTEDIAKILGIEGVPWQHSEPGEWAISDDGLYMQCIKVYEVNKPNVRHISIMLPVAEKWAYWNKQGVFNDKKPFLARAHLATGVLHKHSPLEQVDHWLQLPRTHKGLKLFAGYYFATGGNPRREHYIHVIKVLFPYKANRNTILDPKAYVWWFIRYHVKIQRLFTMSLKKSLEERGVGTHDLADKIIKTFNKAEELGKPKEMLAVCRTLIEILEEPTDDHPPHMDSQKHLMISVNNIMQEENRALSAKEEQILIDEVQPERLLNNPEKAIELALTTD